MYEILILLQLLLRGANPDFLLAALLKTIEKLLHIIPIK